MTMRLVAGVDSSTQACKVSVRDAATGQTIRTGRAAHPAGTIVAPEMWWDALALAIGRAGGLADVEAISVSGQQHSPVFLDRTGGVVCPSPLWNDMGSHPHMVDLNRELGRQVWIRRTGLPITISDTVTKLRWLRDLHPEAARDVAAVAIVHDWLTWRLMGFGSQRGDFDRLVTDRSEASGTGYWSGSTESYCMDLFELALGKTARVPDVLGPLEVAGVTAAVLPGLPTGIPIGVGSGDNAAAALALGVGFGEGVLSLGTSGVVYAKTPRPVADYAGYVCSYADASGLHLPLVATLNAARNFDLGADLLGCSHAEFAELALQAAPGAGGLTLLPYFEGERTPDLPSAVAALEGATGVNFTRPNLARAVIEGTLVSQVAMIDALTACDVHIDQLLLIGGAAHNPAVQQSLRQIVPIPVLVPDDDEYVAKGAAMQAVAALDSEFPTWPTARTQLEPLRSQPHIIDQYRIAQAMHGYDRGSGRDG
ncbi:MAG: FGGY family carbohydrate kinase [Beutenbergiaceae bacterium]